MAVGEIDQLNAGIAQLTQEQIAQTYKFRLEAEEREAEMLGARLLATLRTQVELAGALRASRRLAAESARSRARSLTELSAASRAMHAQQMAGFTGSDVCGSQGIEQGCFSVIDVTHDRDHGRPCSESAHASLSFI